MSKVPGDRKRAVWQRDRYRCRYCKTGVCAPSDDMPQERWATVDHVVPRSQGGDNTKGNLVTACSACNAAKANRTLDEFKGDGGRFKPRCINAGTALKLGYRPAQAIEARRAETQGGSVHESAVRQDAPETPLSTPLPSGSIER